MTTLTTRMPAEIPPPRSRQISMAVTIGRKLARTPLKSRLRRLKSVLLTVTVSGAETPTIDGTRVLIIARFRMDTVLESVVIPLVSAATTVELNPQF